MGGMDIDTMDILYISLCEYKKQKVPFLGQWMNADLNYLSL